eukprot:378302-Rhodomonas_salina.7
MRCPVLTWRMLAVSFSEDFDPLGTCLPACYAMSGTDIAHGGICLPARYAMSGTDIAYGAAGAGGAEPSHVRDNVQDNVQGHKGHVQDNVQGHVGGERGSHEGHEAQVLRVESPMGPGLPP